MKIKFVDIQNFRKLKKVRIELNDNTTLFVGANNSGKTSVVSLFKKFFRQESFSLRDVIISSWPKINIVGNKMLSKEIINKQDFKDATITLDIWLSIKESEIYYVSAFIPTLDWEGDILGVRLALELDDKGLEKLQKEFCETRNKKEKTEKGKGYNLVDFLSENFEYFSLKMYLLDPAKESQVAQEIIEGQETIDSELLKKLIQVDVIDATRQVTDVNVRDALNRKNILSTRVSSYYKEHIEKRDGLSEEDVKVLNIAYETESAYNSRFSAELGPVLQEVALFGYPGLTDSEVVFRSKLPLADSLKHQGSVQYRIKSQRADEFPYTLPEQYNGLGYQNLIDIIFQLISLREEWLNNKKDDFIKPMHLVLIEEPEAHLHAQVQQVFIKQAYSLLTNHEIIRTNTNLSTQLIVSTHSPHIAYECDFSQIRYFKREQINDSTVIPTSTVVNMSQVFGKDETETKQFVERYIKAAHCNLFFADAVILVEGSAERILLPYFIKEKYKKLNQCYLSILEVGGNHAHRLKPLIETLGLYCLVITDLDAINQERKKVFPKRGDKQKTCNPALINWLQKEDLDQLIDLPENQKILKENSGSLVRFCYQQEVVCLTDRLGEVEIIPSTFEDAVFVENCQLFKNIKEPRGLLSSFCKSYDQSSTLEEWRNAMLNALKESNGKAQFALDVLFSTDFSSFHIPTYIDKGLGWLEQNLCKKNNIAGTVSTRG